MCSRGVVLYVHHPAFEDERGISLADLEDYTHVESWREYI